MKTLLRQLFVAILGGAVAASIMLVANHTDKGPSIALAQTNASVANTDSPDADAPKVITYQGQVFNPTTGGPCVNARLNFSFRLYNNSQGSNQLYQEDKFIQTNADGFFNTRIGDINGFGNVYNIFNGQELYLGVFINQQQLGPIQAVTFVPYAFWSVHAHNLDNYDAGDFPKILAYGVVSANGNKRAGDNFNSSIQNVAGQNVYVISLGNNLSHDVNSMTTIVTPACASPAITGVGSSARPNNSNINDLLVDVWDQNANRIQCTFEFMVLQK